MDILVRRCLLLQTVRPSACLVSIVQVNNVLTLDPLIFDYRHVCDFRIVWMGGYYYYH